MDAVDLDVLRSAARWLEQGHAAALVTVTHSGGAAPRPLGALLALSDDGRLAGSVSCGCVEDALLREARESGLAALTPAGLPQVRRFGRDLAPVHRDGRSCDDSLEIVLEPLTPASRLGELVGRLSARELLRRELDLETGQVRLGPAAANENFRCDGRRMVAVMGPRHRLLLIGAGQVAHYLCATALALDFDITVCEPREARAADWLLSGVELTRAMPEDVLRVMRLDERSAVLALSHDPRLDEPAVADALRSPAFYVGLLDARDGLGPQHLREYYGLGREALSRLHVGSGLPGGGHTPAETALALLGAIIAARSAGKGGAEASDYVAQPPHAWILGARKALA